MSWAYSFDARAVKELKKLGPLAAREIVAWLDARIAERKDPRLLGRALKGDLAGLWRCRVGDYRVIVAIKDKELLVLVVRVGHRKSVY